MITERPILFSAPMVRAILDGSKTQTRRIVKDATGDFWDHKAWKPQVVNGAITHWVSMNTMTDGHIFGSGSPQRRCPYGNPGDTLWVRETHHVQEFEAIERDGVFTPAERFVSYRADSPMLPVLWKPSIFMPRWASRITLEVESVRVERLQAISEEDAKAEGCEPMCLTCGENCLPLGCGTCQVRYKASYANLWESINGPGSWEANSWVWVITFKRVKP